MPLGGPAEGNAEQHERGTRGSQPHDVRQINTYGANPSGSNSSATACGGPFS
jgi:hypothetical protein